MKKTQRNTEAEKLTGTTIKKDSTLVVGVESVSVFVNTIPSGDFKGRNYDKYKLKLRVIEPGEYKDKTVNVSISDRCERRTDGKGNVMVDTYGNSKSYAEFIRAIDNTVTDEDLPRPESDEEAKSWGESWVGSILNVTFGTYTFKDSKTNDDIVINTIKETFPVTEDQLAALKPFVSQFHAEIAAKKGGGAADDFNPDDFELN